MAERDHINFIRPVTVGAIAVSTKTPLDLSSLKNQFGDTFNTLTIVNKSGADIKVYLDGVDMQYLYKDGGYWAFDNQMGLRFGFVEIENQDGAIAIVAAEIKAYVGRTGEK